MIKTTSHILTTACVELALSLTEETSTLLITENQALRFRLKQSIADLIKTYDHLLTLVD